MSEGPIFLKGPGEPGTADALKERAATALEQGYRFVEAHGDPLARLRCQSAVEAVAPEAVVQAIEAEQAADGSFGPLIPVRPARWQMELDEWQAPASVAGTLEALAMLAGQKSLVLPSGEAAVEFLGDDPVTEAQEYIRTLASTVSPTAMADTKRMVWDHAGLDVDTSLDDISEVVQAQFGRPDIAEGINSFLEKRPPAFPRLGSPEAHPPHARRS